MPRIVYRHDQPSRFIASAIGEPGQREFFLQVKSDDGINTIGIEKSQVMALTERFEELIREIRRGKLVSPEEMSVRPLIDNDPVELPIEPDFLVGIISITWESGKVYVNLQAASQDDEIYLDDIDEGPDLVVVKLTIEQVKGFCERAKDIVNAGRPACAFCALPIDPMGHLCPRANGYRR